MVRALVISGVLALLAVCLPPHPGEAADEPLLESGRARRVTMPRGRRLWIGRIEVPEGARALSVTAVGNRNVDLYLEYGRPISRRLSLAADAMSRGRAARESVRLLAADGSLRAGTWFVMVEHPLCRRTQVHIEVVARVEMPGDPEPADPCAVPPVATATERTLEVGVPLTLALGCDQPVLRRVRIQIPPDTTGFVVEATNDAGADVDLFIRRGERVEAGQDDADYLSLASGPRDRLVVGGVRVLPQGPYFLEVVLLDACGPVRVTLSLRQLDPTSGLTTWGGAQPKSLEPDVWVEGSVAAGLPGVTWYRVTVPAVARSLHAQLLESSAPLDLLLVRRSDGSLVARAITSRVDERLEFEFTRAVDGPREFVLGVLNQNANEPQARFRLALAFDRALPPPADLPWPPVMELGSLGAQERAAAATVEVTVRGNTGGSGTCVSRQGLILTSRHVLETGDGAGEIQRSGILIAFSRHLDQPPVQGFFARVVAIDADKDLALLEITRDVFRRPVNEIVFPALALVPSGAPRLGAALWVSGYPAEGSARSRTPVIMTRGAVVGLERQGGRLRWIKTDAWIGVGHSGGAVVNERYEMLGVAVATLGPKGVLGLAVPVSAMPAAWRTRIERPDTD